MSTHRRAIAFAASALLLGLAALYFAVVATDYVVQFDDIHEPLWPKWLFFGVMMGGATLCAAGAAALARLAIRRARSAKPASTQGHRG